MKNPLLKYPGSKGKMADWIISFFPPHKVYLEPYFGSGMVFFSKQPSTIEIINDIDGEVVNFFRVLRESPEQLSESIQLTPWAREEYKQAYIKLENENSLERARRFAVKCWQSYGASQHSDNGWRCGLSPTAPWCAKIWDRLPVEINNAAGRLKNTEIDNRDALDLIQKCNNTETLIYIDPPYMRSTRTNKNDLYMHEYTDFDHEILLKLIIESKSQVVISGYDNALYNSYLKNWNKITKKGTSERGGARTECIWINFEPLPMFRMLC